MVIENVSYGQSKENVCDLYLPEMRTSETPVIVLIHGGSWIIGDKAETKNLAEIFLAEQFVVVNINYQLANDSVNFDDINDDINQIISFIKTKSEKYYFSNKKIILLGHSAGAHLALLHALKFDTSHNVKAVVSLAGPTDLTNYFYVNGHISNGLEKYIGGNFVNQQQNYFINSPINFVKSDSPPVFIMHNQSDVYVDINDSRRLVNEMNLFGLSCELFESEFDHLELLHLEKDDYVPVINWMNKVVN